MELVVFLGAIIFIIWVFITLIKCKHSWGTQGKGKRKCFKCQLYQHKQTNGAWVDDYENF